MKASDDNFGLVEAFNEIGEKIYFVNFIEEMQKNESDKQSYFQLLDKKIQEFSDQSKIKNKYLWLLRYFYHRCEPATHNAICKDLEGAVL